MGLQATMARALALACLAVLTVHAVLPDRMPSKLKVASMDSAAFSGGRLARVPGQKLFFGGASAREFQDVVPEDPEPSWTM